MDSSQNSKCLFTGSLCVIWAAEEPKTRLATLSYPPDTEHVPQPVAKHHEPSWKNNVLTKCLEADTQISWGASLEKVTRKQIWSEMLDVARREQGKRKTLFFT